MDLLLYSSLLLISFLTIFLLHALLFHNTKKNRDKSTPPLPPGNLGLPWLGESFEFMSLHNSGISEEFIFHRMAKYSQEVFKTSIIAEPTAVVCGPAGSRFLFSNDNKLVKQWWPLGLNPLLAPTRRNPFSLKNVILMLFGGDDLKRLVGIMDRLAKRHLETKWQGRQEVTVLPLAKNFAFTNACSLAFSMEDEQSIEKLQTLVTAIVEGFSKPAINLPGTAYYRARKAWSAARKQLAEIVTRRRTTKVSEAAADSNCSSSQDALSNLLVAIRDKGEEMSDGEIADRLIGLLITMHDTTHVVITMIFKYLGKNPEIYEAALQENMELAAKKTAGESYLNWEDIQEMKYTWNVTREAMRVWPPAQAVLREALVDITYAGFRIPKGWKLLLSIKALHMDSKHFPEPEKFDPSRFEGEGPLPHTYMPFGGGLNMCPGRNFAHALVLVFIHNAITRFRWKLKLDKDEKVHSDPIPSPASGIPVYLYSHQPSSIN